MKFAPLCLILVLVLGFSFLPPTAQSRSATPCPDRTGGAADIGGITLGMSAKVAMQVATCSNGSLIFQRNVEAFEPKLVKLVSGEKPLLGYIARTPMESVGIRVMGPPGQEIVVGVARELRFLPGSEPDQTAVSMRILHKFPMILNGPAPPALRGVSVGGVSLEGSGWTFNRCVPNSIAASGGIGISFDFTCGRVVGAYIQVSPNNFHLVRSVSLIMTDSNLYAAKIEKFNNWVQLENARIRREQAQRAAGRPVPKL